MKVEEMNLDVPIDQLQHHGILGMKWGVRRSDAELAANAKRKQDRFDTKLNNKKQKLAYREQVAKVKSDEAKARQLAANAKKTEADTKKASSESSAKIKADKLKAKEDKRRYDIEQQKAKVKAKMEVSKDTKQTSTKFTSKDYKHMTDDELRSVVNRMNLEKQYSQLNPVPPSTLKKIMSNVGGAAVMAKTMIDAAGGADAVYTAITGKSKKSKLPPASSLSAEQMQDYIKRAGILNAYNKLRSDSTPKNAEAGMIYDALSLAAMLGKKK